MSDGPATSHGQTGAVARGQGIHAVIHIPHASVEIPERQRQTLLVDAQALHDELLVMTDWFTDELFGTEASLATTVAFPVSRLVVDPERFADDALEPMAMRGMGVIYERCSDGAPLREPPTPAERDFLLAEYYEPHHAALAAAVASSIAAEGHCLIVDGHSFSSTPLPHEADQAQWRPDICLGADDFHTPAALLERARGLFQQEGWRVEVNRPFAGAIVPLKYYRREERVASLMIEVNRSLYMDETVGVRLPSFDETRRRLQRVVASVIG